ATMSAEDNSEQVQAQQAEQERKAEEKRKAKEEQERKAEEERKAKEEQERKAEEERKAKEEQERKAEEERKAKEEQERKAEEERKAKEEQERKAEEERKAQEEAEQNQGQGINGDLIGTAQSVMGTPYVWGGAQPGGFDCSGFIYWAHKESGNDVGRTSTDGYYNKSYMVDSPQVGDLVFFEGTYRQGISHMGIYVGGGQFIHASTSAGVTVSSVNGPYWGDHFH